MTDRFAECKSWLRRLARRVGITDQAVETLRAYAANEEPRILNVTTPPEYLEAGARAMERKSQMTDRLAEIKAMWSGPTYSSVGLIEEISQIHWLISEVERLRDGKFTPEEIHNFCHDLPQTVPACEFAAGCAHRQREFYGVAPDADDAERWRHVREHGCSSFAIAVDDEVWMNRRMDEADAAVDAARKAT